jgi:hypothetical protein
MDNLGLFCPVCHQAVLTEYYFCPNCGNSLREKSVVISTITQIGLYALAFFLPPLGLWPGIKYMAKKSQQARKVGLITIILTLVSTILMLWGIFSLFNSYLSQMNSVLYGM